MDINQEKDQREAIKSLGRPITRRQAIKVGGIAAVGLAFSKPLIETVWPKPAFAQYAPPPPATEGCTPGFWQGGRGSALWDSTNDSDWQAERLTGGLVSNPFIHTTQFNVFFNVETIAALSGLTMLDLVGSGGGSFWPRKTARDVVAAYLNAAFGFPYGLTTGQIAALWYDAVQQYNSTGNPTDKLQDLHNQLDALNNNGNCLG